MAQGSVSRGHYSNQFDCNDPQILALALFFEPLGRMLMVFVPLMNILIGLIRPARCPAERVTGAEILQRRGPNKKMNRFSDCKGRKIWHPMMRF